MRVLHIVENFNGQAVEAWLIRVLATARERFPHIDWHFYCTLGKPGKFDSTVRELGGTIIHSVNNISDPLSFIAEMRGVLKKGRYDVLHCHQDILSAPPLLSSLGLPLHRRIIHVHNTEIGLPTASSIKIALLKPIFQNICLRADKIVGVSKYALSAILDGKKSQSNRDTVIHCGIETSRFHRNESKVQTIRDSFGFKHGTKILLFVGRMINYKNPTYVLEIMEHLRYTNPDIAAVFAGVGPYESIVQNLAQQRGLLDRVRVLGWRSDIPDLMHAADLLIWPGLEEPKEGLGLGVVEAQAAGLRVLMSRNVPEEAVVVSELVNILPLTIGAQAWADAVRRIFAQQHPDRHKVLERVSESSFAIERSTSKIAALYAEDNLK